jgi:hypothetical protein
MLQGQKAFSHLMAIVCVRANKFFLNLLLRRELDEFAFFPSSHVKAFQFSQIEMHFHSRIVPLVCAFFTCAI